uniref:Uncharacterized protein n=1 Tax=Leersia perrieri TaxID=77586 RepID=A0A0D9WTB8_9ORYZ
MYEPSRSRRNPRIVACSINPCASHTAAAISTQLLRPLPTLKHEYWSYMASQFFLDMKNVNLHFALKSRYERLRANVWHGLGLTKPWACIIHPYAQI